MIDKKKHNNLEYLISFPDSYDANIKYPVLFYIHGAGGRGRDLSLLEDSLILSTMKKNNDNRFITVLPQCFADTWFEIFEQLQEFVGYIISQSFSDKSRIYLTGTSMGAYTSWQLAMTMNDVFAAIIPVCGGGMYWNAERLKDIPIWAFHGALDTTVYPEESLKMVAAVNNCGGNANITILPKTGHNAWDDTFTDPQIYDWLLQHSKQL